jgi:potassium-transporting ATPase KdpC subunit
MTSHPSTPSLDGAGGGWLTALRFVAVAIVVCGLLFPAAASLLGERLFPTQAKGSLLTRDGVVVGSALVAQAFTAPGYFSPRPSAAGYDPKALSGSNQAPSNRALRERIGAASAAAATREHVAATAIPSDLVTMSGSGIDPHISPAAARLQVARVAAARRLPSAQVQALVDAHTLPPTFGVLGQARVDVLQLNLALDALHP